MTEKCTREQLQAWANRLQEQIDDLTAMYKEGYKIHPITDEDILNSIQVAKAMKEDKLERARALKEQVHSVNGINTGVIRYGELIGKKVLRWVTKNGKDEYTVDFGKFVMKVPNITIDDMSVEQFLQKHDMVKASDAQMRAKLRQLDKEYTQLEKDMWKDQGAMLGLFDRLVAQEGPETAHTKRLRGLLEKITDPQNAYLNEFKIYIKEQASKNGGIAVPYSESEGILALDVMSGSRANPNEKSAAEVYVHEMVHMAVETAKMYKKGPLAGIIDEMQILQEEARKNITKAQIGAKTWNYIFTSEDSLSEFIAHAMTNEQLIGLLEKIKVPTKIKRDEVVNNWSDWIVVQLVKIYDALREMWIERRDEKTIDGRVMVLATEMMKHNNMTREASWIEDQLSILNEKKIWVNTKIVDGVKAVAEFAGDALESGINNADKDSLAQKFLKGVDVVAMATNPWPTEKQKVKWEIFRKNMNQSMAKGGLDQTFAPEGQISKLWDHIRNDDAVKHTVETYILMRQQIDKNREDTIGVISAKVKEDLDGMTKQEMASITRAVMEIDLGALTTNYDLKQIQEMMKSDTEIDKALEKEYKTLDKLIGHRQASTFYKSQAKGLGYYMATGVSGKAVYKSANRIMYAGAELFDVQNTDNQSDIRKIEMVIDRIASIEGIRYSTRQDRDVVVKAIETKPDGINTIMYLHQVTQYQNKVFAAKNKTYVYPEKGEIKEVRPSYINTRVNWNDEATEKKMRKLGFKKKGDTAVEGIALYVRYIDDLGAFDKQAAAKISVGKRMHAIDNMHLLVGTEVEGAATVEALKETIELAKKEMLELAKEVKLPEMDGFSMEVKHGEIVNYAVSIPKDVQERDMKQQKNVNVVLAKMYAELEEKKDAQELNGKIWDTIIRDQNANYSRRRDMKYKKEYIEIGPDAIYANEGAREYAKRVWKDMPADMRAKVLKMKGRQYIAVRRDLTDMYFGRRAPSLMKWNVPLFNGSIEEGLNKIGAQFIADWLMIAGDIVKEVVALQKIDIVIKTPMVILNNIRSNFNLAIALGQTPWDAAAQTIRMLKATKHYLDEEKKLRQLLLSYRLAKDEAKKKELKLEINVINNRLKENPVYDLMKAGMFTTIMEDVSDDDLTQKTRIEEYAEKATDWIPKQVKSGIKAFWITEDTKLFQTLAMTVQYSDFVARANRYHILRAQGMKKEEALQIILDEHVNYGIDLGGVATWLDKMGFARFIKYFVGANKMLIKKAKEDPVAVMSMAIADELMGQETPVSAMAPFKEWEYTIHGPVSTAWDMTGQHILPPTMLEYFGIIK